MFLTNSPVIIRRYHTRNYAVEVLTQASFSQISETELSDGHQPVLKNAPKGHLDIPYRVCDNCIKPHKKLASV